MAEEKKPIVAFLGPEASYTHQATLNVFPTTSYTLAPQTTIEDVFAAVQNGHAHRGVVPFENSSNGSVVFTLDLFANLNGKYSDILVCGESYVTVRHCLLGFADPTTPSPDEKATAIEEETAHNIGTDGNLGILGGTASPAAPAPTPTPTTTVDAKPPATPLSDLSRIKTLYSHPQAWGQCKLFLSTHLKHTDRHDVSSTSRAAELVAQDKSGTSAAISSITAATVFQLDVLGRGIEDREGNCTRFLVIKKSSPSSSSSPSPSPSKPTTNTPQPQPQPKPKPNTPHKTLLSFTISHSSPGALAHSLSALASHGLNLTSINTRPSGVENWNYIFFVELQGRRREEDGDGDEGAVNRALRELDGVCRGWRWLGSWESAL